MDMKRVEKIDDVVKKMKNLADFFVPYNFPAVPPSEEDKINILKFQEMVLDGYQVVLHFNKHDYGDHYLETFQILGKEIPFLPFCLTCKMAKKFLGNRYLSLIEVLRDNRKIYCWTLIRDKKGRPISHPFKQEAEHCSYDDLSYNYLHPDKINFY